MSSSPACNWASVSRLLAPVIRSSSSSRRQATSGGIGTSSAPRIQTVEPVCLFSTRHHAGAGWRATTTSSSTIFASGSVADAGASDPLGAPCALQAADTAANTISHRFI